ncbi:Serine/threonine-protein kinase SMG1 [Hordeum vulgare]|nr:Serine/threonine-protein kinase SMG1 [Hordeum vulgare]
MSSAPPHRPKATPPPMVASPPAPTPAVRLPAPARMGPGFEVHHVADAAEVDADGFQQPRWKNRHHRSRHTPTPRPLRRSPSREQVVDLCFRCLAPGHPVPPSIPAPAVDPDDGQGGDQGRRDDDPARHARQRSRGRKRRRTGSTPAGRAVDMQMDDLPWPRNPRPQRADGIAMVAGWASACEVWRTVTQPPALRPFRTIRPWPGIRGAHGTRRPRHPPKKAQGKAVKADPSLIPRPIRSEAAEGEPTLVAQDRSHDPVTSAGPSTDSNPSSPDAVVGGIETPLRAAPTTSAQPDQLLYVGPLSLDSEIPDSQAAQHPTPAEADPASARRPASNQYTPGTGSELSAPHAGDETLVGSKEGAMTADTASPAPPPSPDAGAPTTTAAVTQYNSEPAPLPADAPISPQATPTDRFASLPITMLRSRHQRPAATWTLGEFLSAATKHISVVLPTPGKRPRGGRSCASWKLIWKRWAPPRVRFFHWLADQDRCWTSDRLARHGLQHHDPCLLCCQDPETMDHLLLHCPFSKQVWQDIIAWLRLPCTAPSRETSLLAWWHRA